jgi:hypothetical protein
MLALYGFNFILGMLLGLRFRFGIVLALAALAAVEGVAAAHFLTAGAWYVIAICALVAGEAGYVGAAFVWPVLRPAAARRRRAGLRSQVAR